MHAYDIWEVSVESSSIFFWNFRPGLLSADLKMRRFDVSVWAAVFYVFTDIKRKNECARLKCILSEGSRDIVCFEMDAAVSLVIGVEK